MEKVQTALKSPLRIFALQPITNNSKILHTLRIKSVLIVSPVAIIVIEILKMVKIATSSNFKQ